MLMLVHSIQLKTMQHVLSVFHCYKNTIIVKYKSNQTYIKQTYLHKRSIVEEILKLNYILFTQINKNIIYSIFNRNTFLDILCIKITFQEIIKEGRFLLKMKWVWFFRIFCTEQQLYSCSFLYKFSIYKKRSFQAEAFFSKWGSYNE